MTLFLVFAAAMVAQADEYSARRYASWSSSVGICLVTATLQNSNIASRGAVDDALSYCADSIDSASQAFGAMLADRGIDASSPQGQAQWNEQLGEFRQIAINAVEDRRQRLRIPAQ